MALYLHNPRPLFQNNSYPKIIRIPKKSLRLAITMKMIKAETTIGVLANVTFTLVWPSFRQNSSVLSQKDSMAVKTLNVLILSSTVINDMPLLWIDGWVSSTTAHINKSSRVTIKKQKKNRNSIHVKIRLEYNHFLSVNTEANIYSYNTRTFQGDCSVEKCEGTIFR